MSGFKSFDSTSTTDVAIVLYMIITAVFIIVFGGFKGEIIIPLVIRTILLITIGLIIYADTVLNNRGISFIHFFYPVLLLSYFYGETAQLNNYIFSSDLDAVFYGWEQWLFGFQPSIAFSVYFPQYWFSELLHFGYFSYYLLTIGVSLVFYYQRPEIRDKVIFIIITSFLIYYLVFIIFPVVGPQYFFEPPLNEVANSGIFSRLVKLVQYYGEHPTGAFPSSHVGMVVIFLYLSFRNIRWLFILIVPLFALILMATVYVKAHYAIDVIAGLLSAPIVYYLCILLYKLIKKETHN